MTVNSVTEAFLKGYVTYDVRDDTANGTVYVTLASTPRTQGIYSRPTSDTQQAENLKEGINKVFAEIQSGVVPPVGGRIVNVPETGEIAFVGFGSEVVRPADNKKVRADNRQSARRRASLRAEASLCGIIRGDNIKADDSDALDAGNNSESYIGNKKNDLSDPIDDLVSGSEKAEAVAVYIPSVTQKAAQMNYNMQNSQIVQPYEVKKGSPAEKAKDKPQIKIDSKTYKDSGTLQPGVSGTVDQPL